MNKKRIFSIIIIMVMVCAMAAAGCGKKEETTKNKDEPKREEIKKEEADKVEPEKAEEPAATEAKDTNKTKLDDADIEALENSIRDAIIKEYLEPNNVSAEDFSWPSAEELEAWEYFSSLKLNLAGFTEEVDMSIVPGSPSKEIIEALFSGLANWYEESGVENFDYLSDAVDILTKEKIASIDVAAK